MFSVNRTLRDMSLASRDAIVRLIYVVFYEKNVRLNFCWYVVTKKPCKKVFKMSK